jgi:uncharacterized protein (TIGR02246 family)
MPTGLDRLDELEINLRCTDVLNRYQFAVNRHDVEAFVSLFAPDGVWSRPGGTIMRGPDEIRAFISQMFQPHTPVRHVNGGAVVTPLSATSAKVSSLTTVHDADRVVDGRVVMRGPAYIAEYEDEMRLIDGRWLIWRRDTAVTFVSKHAAPIPGIEPPA